MPIGEVAVGGSVQNIDPELLEDIHIGKSLAFAQATHTCMYNTFFIIAAGFLRGD